MPETNRAKEFQRGTVGATESAKECDAVLPEGSDIGLGPGCREFESRHSDQNPKLRFRGGLDFVLLWRDSNHLNGTVRWTVPCRQLDGGNSLISRVSPLGHPAVAGGRTLFPFGEARTIQTELSSGQFLAASSMAATS